MYNRRVEAAKSNRIQTLDSLRGIAALVVILFHYTYRFPEAYSKNFDPGFSLRYGHYGVQLFFIISGFVIYMTVERCKTVGEFAYRRWSRLFPTYWICLCITLVSLHFLGPQNRVQPLGVVATNFTMLQTFLNRPHVDTAYWSLEQELLFYVLIGLVAWRKALPYMMWVCLAWMGLTVALWFVPLSDYKRTLLNSEYSMLFTAGMYFYQWFKGDSSRRTFAMIGLSYLVALGEAVRVARAESAVRAVAESPVNVCLVITLCYVVFVGFVTGRLEWLNNRILLFLGAISYPLYLIHQNLGYGILTSLEKAGHTGGIWLVLPLAISVALASCVNYLFDKPIQGWLRGLAKAKPSAGS